MAVVEPTHFKRSEPLGGPSRWARAIIYSFTWLPDIALVIGFVPKFEPVFGRLRERGELPELTGLLMAFVQMDAACWHLPVVLGAITLLAIDEVAVRLLRRRTKGNLWSWLWVVAAGLAGLIVQSVIGVGLVLPVFKMGSAIG